MSPLIFITPQQGMIFAQHNPPYAETPAHALHAGITYDVFMVVGNTTGNEIHPGATPAKINVSTSGYGIGSPGGLLTTININQVIAPHGQVTVEFEFTPQAGHVCIYAQIINQDGSAGPVLYQNTDAVGLPCGALSDSPFFVYGASGDHVLLKVLEQVQNADGTYHDITPAEASWHPKLHVMDASIGTTVATAGPVQLSNLALAGSYIGLLQVNPVAGSVPHNFHITGYGAANNFVGACDKIITADPANTVKPKPYVLGGYQSHSINLYNMATSPWTLIQWGGQPTGPWDTLLEPNKNFGFSARVFNSSPTPAYNTIVRFWWFDGGVGTLGVLLDTQIVTVPGAVGATPGSVEVFSTVPFPSAPASHHRCAAVSIYNTLSVCNVDASHYWQVPDPAPDGAEKCSAWRNTDSKWCFIDKPWTFQVALGKFNPIVGPGPVELEMTAQHITAEWDRNDKVVELRNHFLAAGVTAPVQYYQLPGLREIAKPMDLGIRIATAKAAKAAAGRTAFQVDFNDARDNNYEVTGALPAGAKPGDIILVNIAAKYPANKQAAARVVEYQQVLHVTKG